MKNLTVSGKSGVKHYPVNGEFDDIYATDLNGAMSVYSYDDVLGYVTEQIRRFKPLVVVTQDINGEYGHGGHSASCKGCMYEAADNSAERLHLNRNLLISMVRGMFQGTDSTSLWRK